MNAITPLPPGGDGLNRPQPDGRGGDEPTPPAATRPISILVSAMGGEGGGVLTDWIVGAAQRADLPVQGTSIPGVAQRTGATTYYIELWPEPWPMLNGLRPVFGLGPCPGDVDVVLATELVEAGRCCERGFVSDRTTLIATPRRVFATSEKSAMADGRFDPTRVFRTLREMPKRLLLVEGEGQALNAIMLGRLAASGAVPLPHDALRAAIAAGVAPEANLRAFEAGLVMTEAAPPAPPTTPRAALPTLLAHAAASLPAEVLSVAEIALPRLTRFQNAGYAARWLARLRPILDADTTPHRLTAEVARQLTLWMAYQDVIEVAAHKSSAARFAEIRAESRAKPGEPVIVTEQMKPGWEEVGSLLPPFAGRRLHGWAARTGRLETGWSMRLQSTSIPGFLRLFALAALRPWRPFTLRWQDEQSGIDAWLARVTAAATRGDLALALEIATLPRLIKGYAETHRRGMAGFRAILAGVVDPALAAPAGDARAPGQVARAREAALADPEHATLRATLAS